MNKNRLKQYDKTKEKILSWILFISFLFFIPIFATFELISNRDEITNDFNNNKTLVCKVNNIKIEVSKDDGWSIDDSYNFVKGPTVLIISKCETKE